MPGEQQVDDLEELNVEGPGGVKAGYKGRSQIMPVVISIILGFWVWYLFENHNVKGAEQSKAQLASTEKLAQALDKQTKVIEQQEKTQRAVIYVLTLPQQQREKLNLVRPEILYEMQGGRYERDR